MRPLLLAVQFLTRLPVPSQSAFSPVQLGRSLLFYPWVGLLAGGLLWLLAQTLVDTPAILAAALVLLIWVLISGGLHLDGLADTVDAWVGGYGDRERTLAIMKDPSSGPMGVSALVLLLLVKFSAVVVVFQQAQWQALLLAPLLARAALPPLFSLTPYVRPGGLGEALKQHQPQLLGWMQTLLLAGAVVVCVPGGWMLLLVWVMFILYWRQRCMTRIGGITGDTAGALVEMIEALMLVVIVL